LVRIEGAGSLPVARLGDSDALEIGDWVLAIGSPFGLERTVSAGIISGKGRGLEQVRRTNFLQTDAAINPGNSGGPLVNIEGEVVGINTAIASSSGGYQGIGFAVPINHAKWVLGQLLARGSVERAYLGVVINEITPQFAELYKVSPSSGVAVAEVWEKSPAATAGIQQGDVITHFAGKQVHSPLELTSLVERAPLESKQPVRIQRDGQERTVDVVMKAMPPDLLRPRPSIDNLGEAPDSTDREFTAQEFGFEVGEMTPEAAQRLQPEGKRGVLITRVDPDSVASKNGLQKGHAILRVGKIAVSSVDEFRSALAKQPGTDGLLLTVANPQRIQLVTLSR
ncbi:MAG: PDZ domain-containing protein, partial [Planctomycetes bacterium]|nr:PDZ domain-containing protein [Planctomycetota bacterium]